MEKFMQFLERLVVALERDATAREVNNALIKAQFDRKNGGPESTVTAGEAILESKMTAAQAEQQIPGETGTKTVAKMTEKRKQMVEEYKKRGWVIDPFKSTADMEKKVKDSPLCESGTHVHNSETVDTTATVVVEDEFLDSAPPAANLTVEDLRAELKKLQKLDYEKSRGVKLTDAEYDAEWTGEKYPDCRKAANVRARNMIATVGGADKLTNVKSEAYTALYKAVQTALKG